MSAAEAVAELEAYAYEQYLARWQNRCGDATELDPATFEPPVPRPEHRHRLSKAEFKRMKRSLLTVYRKLHPLLDEIRALVDIATSTSWYMPDEQAAAEDQARELRKQTTKLFKRATPLEVGLLY